MPRPERGGARSSGPTYETFIATTPALWRPSVEVAAVVTSRLESYRDQTEKWLNDNGIRYRELHMLSGFTAEERASLGVHAHFKASVYRRTQAELFIESEAVQAATIADLSGRWRLHRDPQMFHPGGGRASRGNSAAELLARRIARRMKRVVARGT